VNPNEAAQLLAIAAAYDNRKPDATAAQAWAVALAEYRFEDCQKAIVEHYRTSDAWMMPVHVITAVKKVRGGRIEDKAPQPPQGLDPDDTAAYQAWLRGVNRAIADGREVPTEDYRATRHIRELKAFRKPPALEGKPHEKSADHDERKAQARKELEARRDVPVADPLDDDTEEAS